MYNASLKYIRALIVAIFIFSPWKIYGQANDNCSNAIVVNLPGNGYGSGTVYTDTITIDAATLEFGEYIPAGLPNGKSIWFKFSLPTTRSVKITLNQVGTTMAATDAGWTLYRTSACLPGAAEVMDPPIFNIEGYTHECLKAGDYLLQASIDLGATGQLYFQIQLNPSSAPENDYDFAANPQNLGIVSGGSWNPFAKDVTWEAGCQSVFDGEETCEPQYTKSSWHIFTTDSWVDWIRISLDEDPWQTGLSGTRNWQMIIYEGNAQTDSVNLPKVDSCVLFSQSSASNEPYRDLLCKLNPNTTYSIKILYPTEYGGNMRLRMWERGAQATASPNPTTIPSTHQLGTLTNGPTYSITDVFACNSFIGNNLCGTVAPTDTINSGGTNYDLNIWYTFTIATAVDVNISTAYSSSQPSVRYRIFQGDVTTNCNLTLYDEFTSDKTLYCLPSGTYSVQILGRSNIQNATYSWGSNLGEQITSQIVLESPVVSKFGLHTPSEADLINSLNPLQPGNTYNAVQDTMDCRTTVLPDGDVCGTNNDRALYRVFYVDRNGMISIGGMNYWRFEYRLYRGDARTAPIVGGRLQGLTDMAGCQPAYWNYIFKVCVTPGYYTLVTFGDISDVGEYDRPWFKFDTLPTPQFFTRATAENLGTLSLSNPTLTATPATFTCLDNPDTILGYAPCYGSTKLFYREFYVQDPSLVYFDFRHTEYMNRDGAVSWRVFRGRISTNSVTSLFRDCTGDFNACLDPGWYSVVAYGRPGEDWTTPQYSSGLGGVIGDKEWVVISMDTRVQRFETFAEADSVNSGNPVDWYNTGTAAVPQNHKSYTFGEEFWACYNNLPFPSGIATLVCDPSYNRVSYHVFQITKPSYVYISSLNPYPYGYQSVLLQGNIADTNNVTPPYNVVHSCTAGPMDICYLAPGWYSLVVFANDNHIGRTHTPVIYVDSVGTSKYDFAANAYDYGNIPNDDSMYFAQPASSPDALGRPQSNDFIFCTTGSSTTDPDNVCPNGVNGGTDYRGRKNLWYTFTVTGPGRVYVRVNALTNGAYQPAFAVYKSDDLNFPVVVDSTLADGLQHIVNSQTWWCCPQYNTISFYRDPCSTPATQTDRYYVLVDRNTCGKLPNIQIQVGIRFEPAPPTFVLYDHYSDANVITGTPTNVCLPPYTPTPLDSGYYIGCEGNLTCATKDPTDQNPCGNNTIWYKFESNIGGRIRLNYDRTDAGIYNIFNTNDIKLYYSVVPGDSTSSGLVEVPLTGVWRTHPDSGNTYWGEGCIQKGTYYLMITGCNHLGFVKPKIWILNDRGDFCSAPLYLNVDLAGASSVTVADSAIINCFTIGEGPSETDSIMGCLGTPIGKKSLWAFVEVQDTIKMDFDIRIIENTTAQGGDIDYAIGNGTCAAMSFDNCVDEGSYITLNLKCRPPNTGFWVHVVMPDWATGEIKVEVTARPADSLCVPFDPIKPRANFDYLASCADYPVQFTNQSTVGPTVTYLWDFGDGFTSTQFEPVHQYAVPDTYLVTLVVDNDTLTDTTQKYVIVYPKPNVSYNYSPASPVLAGTPISFIPSVSDTVPTVTYYWSFCGGPPPCASNMISYIGKYPPPVIFSYPGIKVVCLTVTNGNCDSTYCDTIIVTLPDLYSGGPYDGFAEANLTTTCEPPIFAGGPYDGFAQDTIMCPEIPFYVGGPYDGFAEASLTTTCEPPIFAGGPYDGFDEAFFDVRCDSVTVWTGGPYDGFAEASLINCPIPEPFYVGGPYDGFAEASLMTTCEPPIFAGGPYDGFDQDTMMCPQPLIYVGGPYDGFAEALLSGFHLLAGSNDTICVGENGLLIANEPTNWFTSATGGTAVATNTDTLQIDSALYSQLFYAENTCNGNRVPVILTVYPKISPAFIYSPVAGCAGDPVYFTNQTLVSGPSQPSFGSHIMGFGTHGSPPPPGKLTFSSAQYANFSYLYDGVHQQNQAWTANNSSAGVVWAQWNYLSPRSVNRIVFWNRNNCCSANAPVTGRLYYDDGTGWKFVKYFTFPYPSSGNYDSGIFTETQLIFANRWKLELDVATANAPMWGEFQVYSSAPVVGGNITWNFGDGSTGAGGNITHIYADTGTYNVTMYASVPGACPDSVTQSVYISQCAVLPAIASVLQGRTEQGNILLTWNTNTPISYARLEKYIDGQWTAIYEETQQGKITFDFADTLPFVEKPNIYRVYSEHNGVNIYSNLVEISFTETQEFFVKLYPNPVYDQVFYLLIGLPSKEKVHYNIYDATGKLVYKNQLGKLNKGVYKLYIPSAGLTSGIYFMKIYLGERVYNRKFIRVRQ